MPDPGFPVPPPPAFPLSQRVGKGFSQQEYDEAGQPLIQRGLPLGLSAGLSALGGASIPAAAFDLFLSQLPSNQGGILMAATRPRTLLAKLAGEKPWQMTREQFNDEYVFHGAPDFAAEEIRKGGVRPGSWYAKSAEDAANYAWRKGGSPRVFGVRKSELSPTAADPNDAFGQAFSEAGIYTRSGRKHAPDFEIFLTQDPHRQLVSKALKEGKYVPEEVLSQYPDLAKASRTVEPKLMKSLRGSVILPNGEVKSMEWFAEHSSTTNLPKALERGGVRVRGDGIQIHGLDTADPSHLRRALQDVSERNKTVYVETKHANLQFDADQIRNNDFSLKGLRPIQFWLKGEY